MSGWWATLLGLLGAERYKPSAVALASDPVMMILFASGWFATAAGCVAVGVTLLLRRWEHLTMSGGATRLYGALFILFGCDFLMSLTTIFVPVYRLKVVVLGLTAAVMVTTAILTLGRIYEAARDRTGR